MYLIDDMLNFLARPWTEYGTYSGKISQIPTYLELKAYRVRENKQTGQLELTMQFQTTQQLIAGNEYVTGRYPKEWAPLITTAVNASCMINGGGLIRAVAYSATGENPNQIRIIPSVNIPASAYVYVNASWPIAVGGGQFVKSLFSFLERRWRYAYN